MKKKIFTLIMMLLAAVTTGAQAQESSGNGWTYDAGTKTLSVTENSLDNGYRQLDVEHIVIGPNVTSIKNSAFENMQNLQSVVFEGTSQLAKISDFLFYGCTSLTGIDIPGSVTGIGENSFYKTGLTSVIIPKEVATIGNNAFGASENLASVTFEDGSELTQIGSYAFPDDLKSIVIPASVETVGLWFMGKMAERVEFLGTTPPGVTYMEGDETSRLPIENEDCIIIVSSQEVLDAFKESEKWSSYANYYVKGSEPAEGSLLLTYEGSLNIDTLRLPKYVQIGDTFTIYPVEEKYNKLMILSSTSAFEIIDESPYLPLEVKVISPGYNGKVNLSVEAYELMEETSTYCFDPSTQSVVVRSTYFNGKSTVEILPKFTYERDGQEYAVKRIMHFNPEGNTAKHLIVPETIERMDVGAFKYPVDEYEWETIEFLGTTPPVVEVDDAGLTSATTIIVPDEEAVGKFKESPAFNMCEIVVHGTIDIPTETMVKYEYGNDTIKGSIGISFDGKLPASYDKIPENVDSIKVVANPLLGFKLSGDISIIEDGDITKVSDGASYELKGSGSIVIAATFVEDESEDVKEELEKAPEIVSEEPAEEVVNPTVVASDGAFGSLDDGQSVNVISEEVTNEEKVDSYIEAINNDKGTSISASNTVIYDITPVIVASDAIVGKAEVSAQDDVTLALPYPAGFTKSDLESVDVYHIKDNGEIEVLAATMEDNYIAVNVSSFSPFVLVYEEKEIVTPPEIVTYHNLYITESVGAKLVSRYGKDSTTDGGSFTLSLEKAEGYEDCEPAVYVKRGRFGEWKELKIDEVSGYYQIRNVTSDIYVKVSGDGIWPVSNEEVEAQEVKVYTQNGAIIVSTPSMMDVQIISMTASQVAADKVAGQREFRNLAEGIYVVRVGEKIVKVRL